MLDIICWFCRQFFVETKKSSVIQGGAIDWLGLVALDHSVISWLCKPVVGCVENPVQILELAHCVQLLLPDAQDLVEHYPGDVFVTFWFRQRTFVFEKAVNVYGC